MEMNAFDMRENVLRRKVSVQVSGMRKAKNGATIQKYFSSKKLATPFRSAPEIGVLFRTS